MSSIVARFLDGYFASVRGSLIMTAPASDVHPAMLDTPTSPWDGHAYWRPIKSTVTERDLDGLERDKGVALPPLYRELLLDRHFYSLQMLGIDFAAHGIDTWRQELVSLYQAAHDRTVAQGLVPFAWDRNGDAGYLCFDTRHRDGDGDCPVALWDLDRVGDEDEVRLIFSSVEAMLRAFEFVLTEGFPWQFEQAADGTPERVAQQNLMRRFLAVDPHGAGATGRSWWTGVGVEP